GGELDPGGAQRDLGQQRRRVQAPALRHRETLVPQLGGEHGGPDDDVPPRLHRREPHATPARGHRAPPAAGAASAAAALGSGLVSGSGPGRGTVSHTAPATASTSPPGPSSADPAVSLRPSRWCVQAMTRHWSPTAGRAARVVAVIRPSRIAVSQPAPLPRPAASAAAIPLGQSSAAQTTSARTLPPESATE